MLEQILRDIAAYCEQFGDDPVGLEVVLASGRRITHPFPRPRPSARRAGPGYRSVFWDGREFTFTKMQALAVGVLWAAWQGGTPDVPQAEVLRQIGSDQMYLRSVFAKNPAWGTLVVEGTAKGLVRLAVDGLQISEDGDE